MSNKEKEARKLLRSIRVAGFAVAAHRDALRKAEEELGIAEKAMLSWMEEHELKLITVDNWLIEARDRGQPIPHRRLEMCELDSLDNDYGA